MILLPRNRQPTGGIAPRIDWSNPITKGLVYADPGQFGRNLVTGQQSSALTGTKVQGSASGLVRGFGSTFGTGSTDANVTSLTTNATHRTYIITVMRNGAGGGGFGRILDKRTGGAPSETILWSSSTSQLQYGRVHTTANALWDFPVGTLPVGAPQVIGVSYDSGSTANDPLFYVNGAQQTAAESITPSGTPVDNSDAYVIGNRTNDNARNWDGWIGEVLIWDRILSPAEVLRVSQNPWQIFAPQIIWIDSPASGGTDYPESLTETASATETISSVLGFASAQTDTGSATESAVSVAALSAAITEVGSASDTASGSAAGDYLATITETSTATDVASAVAAFLAAISESASATDTASASSPGNYTAVMVEAATASDVLSGSFSALATIVEMANATDSINFVGAMTYTRAPRGAGYPGAKPATERYGMTNTSRSATTNTRR